MSFVKKNTTFLFIYNENIYILIDYLLYLWYYSHIFKFGEKMFDKLKSITDPSKATDEQVTKAYDMLKEYCDKNNTDVLSLVNDDKNIKPASTEIHSNLSWVWRKTISVERIEQLLMDNIEFIRNKAKEQVALEKKNSKKNKK